MQLAKSAFAYDKFGNANKKYLNETLAFEGITDNTGTVSRAIDHANNLQYDYTYDGSGMRLSKTIGGTTHTYLYNGGLSGKPDGF